MIDTQGMTYQDPYDKGERSKVPADEYPEFIRDRKYVFTYKEREELKEIIHEVLDEREARFYREDDEWLYRGTY